MNSYNARMLANIVKWIRDNRKDVPFVYDGVNYTLTIRVESIFIERDNETNQRVHLEDRRFKWPDDLLEVIWKEIENIRLNEIATKLEKMVESSEQKNKELKETLKKGYLDAIHKMLKTENKVHVVTIDNEIYRIFLYSGYVVCSDKEYTTTLSDKGSDFIEKVYQFLNPSTENKLEYIESYLKKVGGCCTTTLYGIKYDIYMKDDCIWAAPYYPTSELYLIANENSRLVDEAYKATLALSNGAETTLVGRKKRVEFIYTWLTNNGGRFGVSIDNLRNFLSLKDGKVIVENIVYTTELDFGNHRLSYFYHAISNYNKKLELIKDLVSDRTKRISVEDKTVCIYQEKDVYMAEVDSVTKPLTELSEPFLYRIYNVLVENKSTIADNQDEVKMDYRKLLLNELSQHMEDFNVLLDNKEFLTKDTEKNLTWTLKYIQETFNGITDNKIIPKSQMQKVKEYLQDKEHVITEVEIIKYISSKLPTFKANEYPSLANVIELILGEGYHVYGDLTQTFVKVKEFFEKNRYKELYEIIKD